MTYNLRLMTAITASFYLALGAGGAYMGLFLEGLGASYFQVSLILTLFIVTTIVASAVYGRYADRLGARRAWLAGGILLQTAGYFLLASAPALGQAAAARVVEGIGAAIVATVSLSIVGDLLNNSPRKGRQMGVYRGFGSIAYAVGALLGGRVADHWGLAAAIAVGGASMAIGAMLVCLLRPGPRPRPRLTSALEAVVEGAAVSSGRRTPLPMLFLAGVALIMAAISASSSMLPLYLNSLGISRANMGNLWSLGAVFEFPSMYFTGMLSDLVGRAPLLAAGAMAIALTQFFYMGAARVSAVLIPGQLARAFGFASFTANAMTYTAELSSEADRAANSGLFALTQNAGQLGGILLGGGLAQLFGFGTLFTFCAALALAATGAFLGLGRKRAPHANATNPNQEAAAP